MNSYATMGFYGTITSGDNATPTTYTLTMPGSSQLPYTGDIVTGASYFTQNALKEFRVPRGSDPLGESSVAKGGGIPMVATTDTSQWYWL